MPCSRNRRVAWRRWSWYTHCAFGRGSLLQLSKPRHGPSAWALAGNCMAWGAWGASLESTFRSSISWNKGSFPCGFSITWASEVGAIHRLKNALPMQTKKLMWAYAGSVLLGLPRLLTPSRQLHTQHPGDHQDTGSSLASPAGCTSQALS